MKNAIVIILIATLFYHCDKNKNPICEEPEKPGYVVQPCYDSTYFDTTIAMQKIQFPYFHLYAPEGATYDYGSTWDSWGGHIEFGCDSVRFEYGSYAASQLHPSWYYQVDTFMVNGNLAYIGYGYNNQFKVNYISFLIRESDSTNCILNITNPQYSYYHLKMFHSFKFGF